MAKATGPSTPATATSRPRPRPREATWAEKVRNAVFLGAASAEETELPVVFRADRLLRVRPAVHGALTVAAAAALLIVTPLGAILLSLLGR